MSSSPSGSVEADATVLNNSSVVTGELGLMATEGMVGTPFTIKVCTADALSPSESVTVADNVCVPMLNSAVSNVCEPVLSGEPDTKTPSILLSHSMTSPPPESSKSNTKVLKETESPSFTSASSAGDVTVTSGVPETMRATLSEQVVSLSSVTDNVMV